MNTNRSGLSPAPLPRAVAAAILHRLLDGRRTLDQCLQDADDQIRQMQRSDRALVHALVYGVLRWQSRLDWIIDQLAGRPKKIDPQVRVILRLGIFQLQYLQRIPASAAVSTAVDLARTTNRSWASGFVNGLLRQAIRREDRLKWPDASKDPAGYLSVTHAMPLWLVLRWMDCWGKEATDHLCLALNAIPAVTIRANTLKGPRETLKEFIAGEVDTVRETRYSPEGLCVEHFHNPLSQWRIFQDGWFQIQSEAAQIVTHCLAPRPGEEVWDVCAGLGTKTAHLAQLMANKGRILATDLYPAKLEKLNLEMKRCGITIVQCRRMDLTSLPGSDDPAPGKFDRILVEAPCSGLGVLQKNPDGKWRVSPQDIKANGERQLVLLENTAPFLKKNGVLVYAVCSLEPEENEQVVDAFLKRHPEFSLHRPDLGGIEQAHPLLTPRGFLTTIPHLHKMDGFFAAAFSRKT